MGLMGCSETSLTTNLRSVTSQNSEVHSPRCTFDRRLSGPQSWSGRFGRDASLLSLLGIEPRSLERQSHSQVTTPITAPRRVCSAHLHNVTSTKCWETSYRCSGVEMSLDIVSVEEFCCCCCCCCCCCYFCIKCISFVSTFLWIRFQYGQHLLFI
jgi:hypothetical protein